MNLNIAARFMVFIRGKSKGRENMKHLGKRMESIVTKRKGGEAKLKKTMLLVQLIESGNANPTATQMAKCYMELDINGCDSLTLETLKRALEEAISKDWMGNLSDLTDEEAKYFNDKFCQEKPSKESPPAIHWQGSHHVNEFIHVEEVSMDEFIAHLNADKKEKNAA